MILPRLPESFDTDNWFALVLDAAPAAMLVTDPTRRLILVNRSSEVLFGFSRSELIGQPLEMLVPVRYRASHLDFVAHFFSAPEMRQMSAGRELFGLRKDGVEIPLEICLNFIDTSTGHFAVASIIDISERKRAERNQQHMVALVESADDAIVTKNLEGTVLSWNPGAERMLGYHANQVIGKPITRLIPDDRQSEEAMIIEKIRAGQRVSHFETVRQRSDGSLVEVSLTISPLRNGAGVVVGASKIMRDITIRRRQEEDLHRSNAELQQINNDLDGFVYTASHDLRAPLTAVGEIAQWILDDDSSLGAESRTRLALIQGRIERMKRLLNDIRDYARAGRSDDPVVATMSAAALVREVIETSYLSGGFTIKCDAVLENLTVSRAPLEQVFHNLISNAMKHHDSKIGIIEISGAPSGSMWRFSVADDGPGVPEQYRKSIFEMFKTLRPRDAVEGSGMGLAIVRRLVEKMGGQCGCEARTERGARFWFDWPAVTIPKGET